MLRYGIKASENSCGVLFRKADNTSLCVSLFSRRVLRYGVKASGKSCAPLLPTLLETLPGRFQQVRLCLKLTQQEENGCFWLCACWCLCSSLLSLVP